MHNSQTLLPRPELVLYNPNNHLGKEFRQVLYMGFEDTYSVLLEDVYRVTDEYKYLPYKGRRKFYSEPFDTQEELNDFCKRYNKPARELYELPADKWVDL